MEPDNKNSERHSGESPTVQSQIETMRQLVDEAEKWSDLLLNYSRSMLISFLPATVLAVGITVLQLFWTLASWAQLTDQMRFLNTAVLLLLAIVALLAVKKEAEAVIRYGANKGRHRKWSQKFRALRETETQLREMLTTTEETETHA